MSEEPSYTSPQSDAGESLRRWAMPAAGHLLALWAFAVLQPTLVVLDQGPDIFIARQIEGWPFVVVLLFYALVPPLLLLGFEVLIELLAGPSWRWRLHVFFVAGLSVSIGLQLLEQVRPGGGFDLLLGALLLATLAAWAYARLEPVRSVCSVLAVSPAVFLLHFLLSSSSSDLIFPPEVEAVKGVHSRVPIVMVVLDETPSSSILDEDGRINSKRFPNLARLARNSTWFRNYASVGDSTVEAIPAELSGERPRKGDLAIYKDHPDNLFTLLGSTHEIEAMEPSTWLCPPQICPNPTPLIPRMTQLASAMSLVTVNALAPERHIPPVANTVGRTWGEALASESPKVRVDPDDLSVSELFRRGGPQFERFIGEIEPWDGHGKPPLHWVYTSLSHQPWVYPPSGKQYAPANRDPWSFSRHDSGGYWTHNPNLVTHKLQRHILQVAFADKMVGRLVGKLKRTGLWDRALVVVTADHGASFRPGGGFRIVSENNADEQMVPLFIKAPGQVSGKVARRFVTGVDVLPTMARILGVRIPWRMDGSPAVGGGFREPKTLSVYQHTNETVLRIPFSRVLRERARTVRRNHALLGGGGFTWSFYGIGPDRGLAGRALGRLDSRRLPGVSLELEQAGDLQHVDPSSPYLPLLLQGELDGERAASVRSILIGLRGRVAAAAPIYHDGDTNWFTAMIPQRVLRPGRNRVSAFAVDSEGKVRRLRM